MGTAHLRRTAVPSKRPFLSVTGRSLAFQRWVPQALRPGFPGEVKKIPPFWQVK
jgi:hypothetical protein